MAQLSCVAKMKGTPRSTWIKKCPLSNQLPCCHRVSCTTTQQPVSSPPAAGRDLIAHDCLSKCGPRQQGTPSTACSRELWGSLHSGMVALLPSSSAPQSLFLPCATLKLGQARLILWSGLLDLTSFQGEPESPTTVLSDHFSQFDASLGSMPKPPSKVSLWSWTSPFQTLAKSFGRVNLSQVTVPTFL